MICSLKLSTIKHEAEIYLSHGLYKEAMAVYENFLAGTQWIHPSLRKIVNESMRRIRFAAGKINWDKDESMSDTKISKTTTKPSGNPMVKDRLKSARALVEMHRHDRALEEYNRLLDKKFITSEVIKGVAQCLVHLVRPAKIAAVVDNIANDIFKNPRNRRAFKLSIAKKINSEQFPQHYSALSHFLVR